MIISLLILAISVSAAFSYLQSMSQRYIQELTLSHAKLYIGTLASARHIYSREVVARLNDSNILISHDYRQHQGAIPLPATFTMLLSDTLDIPNISSRLYSPFPFVDISGSNGLRDQFAKDAWHALNKKPEQDFYRFEQLDGMNVLRYAHADIMKKGCIDCHNNHPLTPNHQWRVGDVRGILEVIVPLGETATSIDQMLKQTFVFLLLACGLVSLIIFILLRHLKRMVLSANNSNSATLALNSQLQRQIAQDKLTQEQLKDMSLTDALTGIANRRYFDQELEKQWLWSIRNDRSLAVIMFDIDYFKPYNDNYGHPKGDMALKLVATVMNELQLRPLDTICRYGGEEFVLILSDTNKSGAVNVAKKIRETVEELGIMHQYSDISNVLTVSAGVGVIRPSIHNTIDELIALADKALYSAKHNGRNRVESLSSSVKFT